ncbi:MAG TPA: CHAD domain-containing protein [Allosphingosinicella sp.]|nr:CHAD domain-containing protein [Allosphingosinicella sp.]
MSDEVELKFDVEPASVARLRATPVLAAVPARIETSESLYFDTPDGALRNAGISLRVRRSGGRIVQTAKRKKGNAAGLFIRQEWEVELPRFALDLDAFGPGPLRRLLGKVERAALKPIIRTRFARSSWQIAHQGSRIEVVLDEGAVTAGRRRTPLTEFELELKAGKPAALFDLAERIGRAAPLRLGTMSKSGRGYALLEGRLGRPAKAEPVALAAAANEAEAFRAVAQACLRHFRLNEIALLGGRDPEALHQARVALRRLRSALSLFRPTARGKDYQHLREELRWFAGQFGEARNLDVLFAGERLPDDAGLRRTLAAERDRAYRRVLAALASQRARALMLRLALWLELGRWRFKPRAAGPVRALAESQLDRQWRKVRRRGAGLAALDADAEHQLRIDVKKLRYAAEFLAPLHADARRGRFIAALRELQEQLGVANDARIAAAVMARLAPKLAAAPVPDVSARAAEKAFRRASAAAGYWE